MANLYRLILLFWMVLPAHAAVAPVGVWSCDGYRASSGQAACESYLNATGGTQRFTCSQTGGTANSQSFTCWGNLGGRRDASASLVSSSCPPNSTASGSTCTCSSGYVEEDNQCVVPRAGTEHQQKCFAFSGLETLSGGVLAQDVTLKGDVSHGANFCYPLSDMPGKGCAVTFSRGSMATWSDGSKVSYGTYSMTPATKTYGNNQPDYSCSADAASTPKPNTTSTGQPCSGYVGTVNGVETCVPGTSSAAGVDITGGSSTTTSSDGSTSTSSESTKCTAASCTTTTTTTTTTSSGSTSTSTRNDTTDRATFCRGAGSGTAACGDGDGDKDKGKFGGSCAAGFTCEGDAVQCAIAREQHVRACKLFDDKSPESELYAAEVAKGTQRNVTGDLPGNETIDVASKLSTGNLLGTAQCIGDLTVTVWGKDVALPVSKICPALGYLGWVLVAVAGVAAFRIVSGTSSKES